MPDEFAVKTSILDKLEGLKARHEEIAALLAEPEVIDDQGRFRELSQEYAQLDEIVATFQRFLKAREDLDSAREMARDSDPDLRALAEDEVATLGEELEAIERELQTLLLPRDPHDHSNAYLEIRAGTGGDEAALFAGNLLRMYSRYCERCGWTIELMSESEGEHGGYKEVIARISGREVFSRLKFESGAHRVQRVPETESQGRIHTSAATVAVMPEVDEVEAVEVNPADLRVDTYRSSGAGGQHVNKTDSAVRLTHLPSGIVVECQDERSQHKNRARAMSLLQAKLTNSKREKQLAEQAETRRMLVGTGDRSDRIRTYNFPQGRVTDHRINLTLYKIEEIMAGNLDLLIDPLTSEHQADLLASLAESA